MRNKDVKVYCLQEINDARKTDTLLNKAIADFTAFKKGEFVSYFGRNAPIHHPKPAAELAGLMHLHILSKNKYKDLNVLRFRDRYGLTGDSFLIYTSGFLNPNYYCILDYVKNNAHTKINDLDYVRYLIDRAESFRSKL